jgi:PhnB protein
MATINPYLNFDGNCEEAFNFYKSIFGGEFQTIMRFKDAPLNSMPNDGSDGNWLLHVALPIGKVGGILMGSDRPKSFPMGARNDSFSVSVDTESEAEARKLFDALSKGGNITMPFDKTFWGSLFGMFTDKYGIQWMVGYSLPQTQS